MSTQAPEKIEAVAISLLTERLHRMKLESENPIEDDLADPAKQAEFLRRIKIESDLIDDAVAQLTVRLLLADLIGLASVAWTRFAEARGVAPLDLLASDIQRRDMDGGRQ